MGVGVGVRVCVQPMSEQHKMSKHYRSQLFKLHCGKKIMKAPNNNNKKMPDFSFLFSLLLFPERKRNDIAERQVAGGQRMKSQDPKNIPPG